jgi:hypothetical protein
MRLFPGVFPQFDEVLVFEGQEGWNQSGDISTLQKNTTHSYGYFFLAIDGSVVFEKKTQEPWTFNLDHGI